LLDPIVVDEILDVRRIIARKRQHKIKCRRFDISTVLLIVVGPYQVDEGRRDADSSKNITAVGAEIDPTTRRIANWLSPAAFHFADRPDGYVHPIVVLRCEDFVEVVEVWDHSVQELFCARIKVRRRIDLEVKSPVASLATDIAGANLQRRSVGGGRQTE